MTAMKGIGVRAFGGPEALELLDWPVPEPGPGEARVKLAVAGVNFMDVYMRSGQYAKSQTYATPLPLLLGMEGAGVVDAVGPGVEDFRPGDRVAWCISRGAYARVRGRAGVEAGAGAGRAWSSTSPRRCSCRARPRTTSRIRCFPCSPGRRASCMPARAAWASCSSSSPGRGGHACSRPWARPRRPTS